MLRIKANYEQERRSIVSALVESGYKVRLEHEIIRPPQGDMNELKFLISRFPPEPESNIYIIVEGHGRWMACKQLGMVTVPVIRLDHLTDEQRREYMLIHNQTTMNSGWDAEILSEELGELVDFDAGFYGFDIDTEEYGVEDETEPKEKPTDTLPDSRICVFSVSAFGTDSECFVEVQLSEDEAARLLERVKEVEISDIAERLKEVLNAL